MSITAEASLAMLAGFRIGLFFLDIRESADFLFLPLLGELKPLFGGLKPLLGEDETPWERGDICNEDTFFTNLPFGFFPLRTNGMVLTFPPLLGGGGALFGPPDRFFGIGPWGFVRGA